MTRSREQDRLDVIEKLIQELKERGPEVAVLVEGSRDVAALEALDVPGPLLSINTGASLLNLCESIATSYESFIILTDWDRKGVQLAKRLEEILVSTGVPADLDFRRRLGRALPYQIHDVEALHAHVRRLRLAVGVAERRPSSM